MSFHPDYSGTRIIRRNESRCVFVFWAATILRPSFDSGFCVVDQILRAPLGCLANLERCDGMLMEKISIFVDVQNVYYTTRQAFGRQFNYRKFWDSVDVGCEIVNACAYAIEPANAKQKGFQQILQDIGFGIKLKPYIQRKDGSAKADWDVGIALDMFEQAEHVDRIILVSGDGDFDIAVERIQTRFGTRTDVFGVKPLTAQSLIAVASVFREIDETLLL